VNLGSRGGREEKVARRCVEQGRGEALPRLARRVHAHDENVLGVHVVTQRVDDWTVRDHDSGCGWNVAGLPAPRHCVPPAVFQAVVRTRQRTGLGMDDDELAVAEPGFVTAHRQQVRMIRAVRHTDHDSRLSQLWAAFPVSTRDHVHISTSHERGDQHSTQTLDIGDDEAGSLALREHALRHIAIPGTGRHDAPACRHTETARSGQP
jgi:hypothetical protein